MTDKLPALHLYVQDYLADTRSLSNELKGFYVDLLCYMHKSSRRGYLQQSSGNPYSPEQLGKLTGCSADEASRLLRDLLSSEVISATPKGIPYSRRMVRDEKKRVLCKKAGALGGNPTLKGQVKGGAYPSPEDESKKDPDLGNSGGDARGGAQPFTLPVRSQEAVAHAAARRVSQGPTQADYDRAGAVLQLYPTRAKDGRAVRVDLAAQNLLAVKIAESPDFAWEDACSLEQLNETPTDAARWIASQPDPVLLETRRRQAATAVKAERRYM